MPRPVPVLAAAVVLAAVAAHGAAAATPGQLRLTEVRVAGSPIPIEGEVTYVRLTRPDGTRARTTALPPGRSTLRLSLAPGTFGVEVWHRFCDGNCGYLDAPGDRCRARVSIRPGTVTRLTVHNRPGSPCRIGSA